jgi:hypothetical protein
MQCHSVLSIGCERLTAGAQGLRLGNQPSRQLRPFRQVRNELQFTVKIEPWI